MIDYRRAKGAAALLFLLSLASYPGCRSDPPTEPVTTVFVVRHAEKAENGTDPDLSEMGQARARQLRDMLSALPVSALYATEFRRTQQTLSPLAEDRGLPVNQIPAAGTGELVTAIQSHRGGVIVAAGHSNTVPSIVNLLAGTDYQDLDEQDYDNLFVVLVGDFGAKVLQLKFAPELGRE